MENLHRLVLVIIQSLHNKLNIKNQESGIKAIIALLLILFSLPTFTQDSIPATVSVDEKESFEFQEAFFNALTQKAINNHQKAILFLETCNSLNPNKPSVLFEFSKNYLFLNKGFQALEYANQALEKSPNNLWIQEHIVKIFKREKNYEEAIKMQEVIAKKYPKKRREVVFLHIKNDDLTAAKNVLLSLESKKLLNPRLRRIKKRLFKATSKKIAKNASSKKQSISLVKAFEKEPSYKNLVPLLLKLKATKSNDLISYSEKGLELFPAQPLMYLMNAQALNNIKKHKKAIDILLTGFDFIIDDLKMEKKFYKELAKAYQNIGDEKNAQKYLKKAL